MKQYVQLAAGFFTLLFLGVAYAWSLFVAPLEEEFGWSRDQTSLIFTISMICFCLGGMAGGILNAKMGHRPVLVAASFMIGLGFWGCSHVAELWQIYLSYGVLCGLSIGISYNVVISTVNSWFENRVGFSSGIMMMGYGIGSFVLGSIVSYANGLIGWRSTYCFLAGLFFLLLLAAALVLSICRKPQQNSLLSRPLQGQRSPLKMLHMKTFYCYYFWCVALSAIGLGVIGHAALMAESLGASSYAVVLATGAFSIANGVSRVLFGILYDRLGRRAAMISSSCIIGIGVVLVNVALALQSLPLLFTAYCFTGLGYGSTSPCNSAFVKEYYGSINYGKNFSITTSTGIIASIAGPYVLGLIMSATSSYTKSYPYFLVFVCIALMLQCLLTKYSKPWYFRREHYLSVHSPESGDQKEHTLPK